MLATYPIAAVDKEKDYVDVDSRFVAVEILCHGLRLKLGL